MIVMQSLFSLNRFQMQSYNSINHKSSNFNAGFDAVDKMPEFQHKTSNNAYHKKREAHS